MARILIVDDSAVARKALENMIYSLGHQVVGEASNGLEAFNQYAKLKPDLVTMDLTMGGNDGADATSKIIEAFPESRIIVISAQKERQVIIDALERGARHFIMKPVSSDKLSTVINHVLQQKISRQKQLEFLQSLKHSSSARVLVVDDSAVARKKLQEIMLSLGHSVVGEAANGAQAFVEYAKLKPDVVTMDLTMQGLGGAEATSKIISSYPEARIIVISAIEERKIIIDALERGARHFIIKPIRQEKVAAVMQNIMQQEFDLQKHMDCVRKLKQQDEMPYLVSEEAQKLLPPYSIVPQDNRFVQVFINESLTIKSCESLFLELEEYLNDLPRVLLDFGKTSKLDQQLFDQLNKLVEKIEGQSGAVKAISNNKKFVEHISLIQPEKMANFLADVLRYLEC